MSPEHTSETAQFGKMTVAPIEHLFLAEDRPQYSMCFFIRLVVEGELGAQLGIAFVQSLERHPLLRASLKGDPCGPTSGLAWLIGESTSSLIVMNPSEYTPIQISDNYGVRLYINSLNLSEAQSASHELMFQFHHAATDARGAMQFIEDFLTNYQGKTAQLTVLNEHLLQSRAQISRFGMSHKGNFLRYAEQFAGYFLSKCAGVAAHNHATGEFDAEEWPTFKEKEFDQTAFRCLKSRSVQKQSTINDLIMRDVMLALSDWNNKSGSSHNIRVGMPINMRSANEGHMPAANFTSMCSIERSIEQIRDPWQLLSSITKETTYIKENRLGFAFLLAANVASKIKGGMQSLLKQKKGNSLATTVIANLGEVFRYASFPKTADGFLQIGNLKLTKVSLVPPVRHGTKVTFGVVTYMRRLSLTMHFDQIAMTKDDAKLLFDLVVGRLNQSSTKDATNSEDLETLIKRHAGLSASAPGFRSLPLGKHVAPTARINQLEGKPGHSVVVQLH
jgi:NRPS condensation-like uncharacterized protein